MTYNLQIRNYVDYIRTDIKSIEVYRTVLTQTSVSPVASYIKLLEYIHHICIMERSAACVCYYERIMGRFTFSEHGLSDGIIRGTTGRLYGISMIERDGDAMACFGCPVFAVESWRWIAMERC